MKRWVTDRHGRDGLRTEEVPLQHRGPVEMLVRVRAVSLNDAMILKTCMGLELAFPWMGASDMAGIAEAVSDNVTRFRVGDRVISHLLPEWIDGKPSRKISDGKGKTDLGSQKRSPLVVARGAGYERKA